MSETTPSASQGRATTGRERLHKFLASTGAGSRRECETFIAQGRVAVNGKVVTKMGVQVEPERDVVTLDGERVRPERLVYYLLHKPPGFVCTNADERGRPRVVELIRDHHRIYTVGRLDADSTGLILLTNDGAISNVICHPRYRIEKVYQVVVRGNPTREQLARVEAGVWLSEGRSSPANVRPVARNPRRGETVLEMTLFEGRNREIRRIFAKVGLTVRRLQRSRIGPLELGDLPLGRSRPLDPAELSFVGEAERLYLANKQAWDADLPDEGGMRRPRPRQGARPRTTQGGRGPQGWQGPRGGGQRGPRTQRPPPRGRGPR